MKIGNIVSLQNQAGPRAKKWDKTGVIIEVLPFDQYRIRVDGSGRVTLRNRQFLRRLGHDDSITDTAPTQPVDTLDQVGAEVEGGVSAEYASAASEQHIGTASYSDVVKSSLPTHHFI